VDAPATADGILRALIQARVLTDASSTADVISVLVQHGVTVPPIFLTYSVSEILLAYGVTNVTLGYSDPSNPNLTYTTLGQ
jgi:hypothetical protein